MNNKIDVNDIMKELEEKIKLGLSEKKLNMTNISMLISEHLEKAKEKVLQDAGDIISNEAVSDNQTNCTKCGKGLKKTKK